MEPAMDFEKPAGWQSRSTAMLGDDKQCRCHACIEKNDLRGPTGWPLNMTQMIVCPVCGDKRCIHAKNHEAPCAKADIYGHNAWIERNMTPNAQVTGASPALMAKCPVD